MGNLLAINGEIINSQEPLPIPVDILTLLWENPDPTADFAQQQITLSENATNYEFLMIELKYLKSADYRYNVIGHTGNNIILSYGECGSKGAQVTQRNLYLVSGYPNKVMINNCELATGSTASTTANDHCIPLSIYGFNTQVPMQDGGASRGSVSVTADGVKTYAQVFNELYSLMNASKITKDTKLIIDMGDSTNVIFELSSYNFSTYYFINSAVGNTTASMSTAIVKGSSSEYKGVGITSSSVNFNNASNTVPTSGFKFIINY